MGLWIISNGPKPTLAGPTWCTLSTLWKHRARGDWPIKTFVILNQDGAARRSAYLNMGRPRRHGDWCMSCESCKDINLVDAELIHIVSHCMFARIVALCLCTMDMCINSFPAPPSPFPSLIAPPACQAQSPGLGLLAILREWKPKLVFTSWKVVNYWPLRLVCQATVSIVEICSEESLLKQEHICYDM